MNHNSVNELKLLHPTDILVKSVGDKTKNKHGIKLTSNTSIIDHRLEDGIIVQSNHNKFKKDMKIKYPKGAGVDLMFSEGVYTLLHYDKIIGYWDKI